LVRRQLERQDVVGRVLVRHELELSDVVRTDVERVLLVEQDLERPHVVESHLERIGMDHRVVGRRRCPLRADHRRLGEHLVGEIDGSATKGRASGLA
jgi:hypothetical protein